MKTDNKINLNDLEEFLRLIEVQREFAYHLQRFKELTEQRVEEMKILVNKGHRLAQVETRFRNIASKLKKKLTDEQIKEVNKLLQKRFMKVKL